MPPGFDTKMFEEARLGPAVQPARRRRHRRRRRRAVGADGHGRAGAADRLRERREPVPGPGRGAAAGARGPRGARRRPAAARARAAVGELDARRRSAASLGARRSRAAGIRLLRRAGARRACPALDEIALDPVGAPLHARRCRCSPACCSACCRRCSSPRPRARPDAARSRGAAHDGRRAPPRAQRAGRRAGRARARAAGRLRPDDPDVPGAAARRARLRRARPSRSTFRISIPATLVRRAGRGRRALEQIARRIAAVPGVDRRSASSSSIPMDGGGSNDPMFVEDFPGPQGSIPPLRALQVVGRRATSRRWAIARRRAATSPGPTSTTARRSRWSPRTWRASSGGRRRRPLGKRIRQTPAGAVARDRRRRRRRARRRRRRSRRRPIVYWPMLMSEFWSDDVVSPAVRWRIAVRTAARWQSPTLLKEVQQAVWSVNGEPAARQRADARRDPCPVDGADLVRAGDAGHRRASWRCCSA